VWGVVCGESRESGAVGGEGVFVVVIGYWKIAGCGVVRGRGVWGGIFWWLVEYGGGGGRGAGCTAFVVWGGGGVPSSLIHN